MTSRERGGGWKWNGPHWSLSTSPPSPWGLAEQHSPWPSHISPSSPAAVPSLSELPARAAGVGVEVFVQATIFLSVSFFNLIALLPVMSCLLLSSTAAAAAPPVNRYTSSPLLCPACLALPLMSEAVIWCLYIDQTNKTRQRSCRSSKNTMFVSKEMVTEVASSLLLQTNVSVLVVRTSAMRMLLTETSLDFAANVSLVSLSHIHAQRCAHADTHTHMRACSQASHSSVSGSFCLLSACRLEDGGSEGGLRERRVARQNGWSHEQRSVYKPKAERSESKGRKRRANCRLSLSTIKDWKRKRGRMPWQSQLEVGEIKHDTRRHTRCLCLWFFFSPLNWRSRWLEGE